MLITIADSVVRMFISRKNSQEEENLQNTNKIYTNIFQLLSKEPHKNRLKNWKPEENYPDEETNF